MRMQAVALQENLKYCSPLGSVLRSLRRTVKGGKGGRVGVATIRRLEGAGIRNLRDLAELDVGDLVGLGVRRDLARQIRSYVRRRMQ